MIRSLSAFRYSLEVPSSIMVFFVALSTLDLNSSSNSFCSAVLLVRRAFFDFITASKSALAIDSACALNSSCNVSLISLAPVAFLGEGFRLGRKVPATKWASKDSTDDLICEMLRSTVTTLLTATLISVTVDLSSGGSPSVVELSKYMLSYQIW